MRARRHYVVAMAIRVATLPLLLLSLGACQRGDTYTAEEETARQFALALESQDTVKMRELSLPIAGSKMAAALSELPRAYTDFGADPRVIRRGNPQSLNFFAPSRKLTACGGGTAIALALSTQPRQPRVASFRPAPDPSSAATDRCHDLVRTLP